MYRVVAKFSLLVILYSSCSGYQYQRPESIEDKMTRFENHHALTNQVPHLILSHEGIEKLTLTKRSGRAPASVSPDEDGQKSEKFSVSNKKLYFMSLYSQYEKMRSLTPSGSTHEINICPSFHTGLVEFREAHKKSASKHASGILPFSYQIEKLASKTYLSYYPELSLPLTDYANGPTVAGLVSTAPAETAAMQGQRLLSQAFHRHVTRVYNEISELCETGTSSNYYNFENLLTHVRTKEQLSPSAHSLEVLMRTSIVANLALIESLAVNTHSRGRAPASSDIYTQEALERLGTPWALEYMKNLVKMRK